MAIDLKSTYLNFPPPLQADECIRSRLEKLARRFPDIVSCELVGEESRGHELRGKRYRIAVAVGLSGGETVADHEHAHNHANENFLIAVGDAFDALERALESHVAEKKATG